MNRVLFVERSGELRWLARLRTKGPEPKGNQVLIGLVVSRSGPETGWSPLIQSRFLVSRSTLDTAMSTRLLLTGLSPSLAGFPKTILLDSSINYAVRTPACTHAGLGSSGFARRYFQNHMFFLFLRLLRCFSSPGSPPYVMDWRMDT